jgi:prepilin-type N-terminal cleavage/methylation domain-containing protein
MNTTRLRFRPAFTLVEIIVVMTIILVLASLAVAFYPDISTSERATRGASSLQEWLLIAKQRAKRDGLPTGLRFLPFTNGTQTFCNQMVYIQQPPDFAVGRCTAVTNGSSGSLQAMLNVNVQGSQYTQGGTLAPEDEFDVQNGDYLELYGSGYVHQIFTVTPSGTTSLLQTLGNSAAYPGVLTSPTLCTPLTTLSAAVTSTTSTTISVTANTGINLNDMLQIDYEWLQVTNISGTTLTVTRGFDSTTASVHANGETVYDANLIPANKPGPNYRIIRQPRELPGEPTLILPYNISIDMNTGSNVAGVSGNTQTFSNPPKRSSLNPSTLYSYFEIIFSPTGSVIGSGNQSPYDGQIYLWVRDTSVLNIASDPQQGDPTIIAVQTRSGLIGAYSVAPVRSTTLTAAVTAAQTTITVASSALINVNDVLKIDSEELEVTNVSGTTLTVVRGFAGTTAAAHANSDTVYDNIDPFYFTKVARSSGL